MTFDSCREGIRLAVLQSRGDDQSQLRRIASLSVIPTFAVSGISLVVLYWYAIHRPGVDIAVVIMYCLGALLEILAEPFYNLYYCRLIMLPRLRSEMAAVTCRSVATFLAVVVADYGIRGFGVAQVVYGGVYLFVMLSHVSMLTADGAPVRLSSVLACVTPSSFMHLLKCNEGGCDDLLILAAHATASSLLKHILTEGDKIVLSISASHFNQGIYAITSNYGSLVARILFHPIEESCRVAFSRMCSAGGHAFNEKIASFSVLNRRSRSSAGGSAGQAVAAGGVRTRSKSKLTTFDKENTDDVALVEATIASMAELLTAVLRGIVLFALLFPVIGSSYCRVGVKLALGSEWYMDETVATLSTFCFYILAISINGISESFVHAVISPKSLNTFNMSLVASWVIFMGSSVPLMARFGTSGLVMANALGMTLRGCFNLYFAQSFIYHACSCDTRSLNVEALTDFNIFHSAFPPIQVCLGCIVLFIVCLFSGSRFAASNMLAADIAVHIGVGIVCGCLYLSLVWIYCRSNVTELIYSVRSRGKGHID